jgi:hypothetical protein
MKLREKLLIILLALTARIFVHGTFLKRKDAYLSSDPFEMMKSSVGETEGSPISQASLPPRSESLSASSLTGPTTYNPDDSSKHQYYQSETYKKFKEGDSSKTPADILQDGLTKSAPGIMIPDELAELMLPIFPVNSPTKESSNY